jgi:hypothetical protein
VAPERVPGGDAMTTPEAPCGGHIPGQDVNEPVGRKLTCLICGGEYPLGTTHCPGKRLEPGMAELVRSKVVDFQHGAWVPGGRALSGRW